MPSCAVAEGIMPEGVRAVARALPMTYGVDLNDARSV